MPKTTDVFKTQGTPTYTYVSVSDGTYEQDLCNAIENKGTLCLVTGPSKTGKTTLISNVCKTLHVRPIIVRCNDSSSPQEIWRKALEQIDFSRITQVSQGSELTSKAGGAIESAIGWQWLAKITGKISFGIEHSRSEEECREKILSEPSPEHLVPVLKCFRHLLVIEDFHYLSPAVQKNLFQQWKSFVDEEVSVAVIGTTHHAHDLAFANKDLVGRIYQLQMTTWTCKDLRQIAVKGFDALNVEVDERIIDRIAEESVGLPLLAQTMCLELALKQNIRAASKQPVKLDIQSKHLFSLLTDIATAKFGQFGGMYNRIKRGLRNGKKKKYNTYEYLLLVFSLDPIVYKLEFNEILHRLSKLPGPQERIPPERTLITSLSRLNQLQKTIDAELLEWHGRDQTLYIVEPSFLFFLRWKNKRSSAPTVYDFIKDIMVNLEVVTKGKITSVRARVEASEIPTAG